MAIRIGSETDTVIKKIVPYLQRRGYDLDQDIEFEAPGPRAERLSQGYIDLLVSIPGHRPAVIIEAKRSGKKLTDRDKNQALGYGRANRVPFVVVTNGTDIRCFNTRTGDMILWDGRTTEKIPTKEQLKTVLSSLRRNKELASVPLGLITVCRFGQDYPQSNLIPSSFDATVIYAKSRKQKNVRFKTFRNCCFLSYWKKNMTLKDGI